MNDQFILQGFNEDVHVVCHWDEFKGLPSVEQLKLILGGETVVTDVKGSDPKILHFRVFL